MDDLHRPVLGYLAGVVVLAASICGLLVWLFFSRIPVFTDELVRNPVGALQSYPIVVVLVVGIFVATLLLVGLVVGFGVWYGPDETPKQ